MVSTFGPFVLGGNVFGWTVKGDDAFRLLDAFVDRGGTAIDTADSYNAWMPGGVGGESETLLGEWMTARKNRSRVLLATKVGQWDKRPGLSAANLRAAVEGSLRRLQTDHIDLYFAHADDPNTPQSEYLTAFDSLVKEGKVRALGASNFTPERLTSALTFAREHGLRTFEVSQDHWNLVERDVERALIPVLQKEGLVELPYFSLASGFLTGKYRPGNAVTSERAGMASQYLADRKNLSLLAKLDELAASYRASVAAVALAWLRVKPVVGAPIASARTIEQLDSLFESARLTLAPAEVAALSEITAPGAV